MAQFAEAGSKDVVPYLVSFSPGLESVVTAEVVELYGNNCDVSIVSDGIVSLSFRDTGTENLFLSGWRRYSADFDEFQKSCVSTAENAASAIPREFKSDHLFPLLRSADNIFSFLLLEDDLPMSKLIPKEESLKKLETLGKNVAPTLWTTALNRLFFIHATEKNQPPSFRATCVKTDPSKSYAFTSVEAAAAIGAGAADATSWKVDLVYYNAEVWAQVAAIKGKVVVGLNLFPKSAPGTIRWYRQSLGPTSLKPSLAYAVASKANIKERDIVLDPMCGHSCSLPLEAAGKWKNAIYLAGDIKKKGVSSAAQNVNFSNMPVGLCVWDATELPLAQESVDVVISDIPFGRRCGSYRLNTRLYPLLLKSLERILKVGGRAILLTPEKKLMERTVEKYPRLQIKEDILINYEGLLPRLFTIEKMAQHRTKRHREHEQ